MTQRTLFGWFRRKPKPAVRAPPRAELSTSLSGYFEVRVDRIVGRVKDLYNSGDDGMRVEFLRRGQVVASCEATWEPDRRHYAFGLPIEGRFTGAELVREQVVAIACDREGRRGRVLLDGAAQLELIRDHLGSPAVVIFDLDFSRDGNARPYLGEGWSGAERDFTWTVDDDSIVTFGTPSEPGTYALRFTAGQHVRGPKLPAQVLTIFVNETQVALFVCTEALVQFREAKFSHEAFGAAPRTTLRLHHPDAARPSDFGFPDTRRLAFSFKRLSLARLSVSD